MERKLISKYNYEEVVRSPKLKDEIKKALRRDRFATIWYTDTRKNNDKED